MDDVNPSAIVPQGGGKRNGAGQRKPKRSQRKRKQPPAIPQVQVEHLPATLRRYAHFVTWEFQSDDEAKDPAKEWRKTPLQPWVVGMGDSAKTNDPATWASYEAAMEWYLRAYMRAPGSVGLGYVFAKLDRKRFPLIQPKHTDELTLIDLDHCRDPDTGAIDGWALDIVRRLNSYSEVSPSGTGVHVIVRGTLARSYKTADIEVYAFARYTTLTGNRVPDTPADINAAQEALDWLVARLEKDVPAALDGNYQATRDIFTRQFEPVKASDKDLLDRIRRSAQGEKFTRLFDEGDWASGLLYASQSEAVAALVAILAWWTRKDAERVDRLFRASKLFSGKWLHKWDDPRGDTTLGVCEIAAAFAVVGDKVYTEPAVAGKDGAATAPGRLVLRAVADITAERTTWLFPGYLPGGELAALAGAGGAGKTSVALAIAVAKAGGLPLPGGAQADVTGPMGVIYLTSENHPAKVLRPRIEAEALHQTGEDRAKTDAILKRIFTVQGVVTLPNGQPLGEDLAGVPEVASVVLPRDTEALRAAIREHDVGLVIIDPIISFSERDLDVLNPADMRKLLDPMARLAQEEDISVWTLLHFTKAVNTAIIMRISLSRQMTDTARAVGVVLEDPNDTRWRWLAMVKNNLGAAPPAFSFALHEVVHPAFDDATTAVVAWGETRQVQADKLEADLIAEAKAAAAALAPPATKKAAAVLYLRVKLVELAQQGDLYVTTDELERWQQEGGFTAGTWHKARTELGIKTAPTGHRGQWSQPLDELDWLPGAVEAAQQPQWHGKVTNDDA